MWKKDSIKMGSGTRTTGGYVARYRSGLRTVAERYLPFRSEAVKMKIVV